MEVTCRGRIQAVSGPGGWHFLHLPKRVGQRFASIARDAGSPWGSLRVSATIGATTWATSVFPDKKSGTYLLPVKSAVRKAEGLVDGADCKVQLRLAGPG